MDYSVYLGVWTNWSRGGQITGSTLTLGHSDGALLTAFIALFVTFVGSRSWRIGCFILHRFLQSSQDKPQDGLYHQRQAILRNAIDEKASFVSLLRVLSAWRRRAHRPLSRLLPIIAFSLLITVIFTLASIFSSKISTIMGDEVLLSSPNCGIPVSGLPGNVPTMQEVANTYQPWIADKVTTYANIAQRCRDNMSKADSYVPFVKSHLPSVIDRDAACPFEESICHSRNGNIQLDSGYIDSRADLGLNSPADLQFNLRIVTQCAPLNTQDHQRTVYVSPDRPYTQYLLGTQPDGKSSYTYEVEDQSAEVLGWQIHSSSFVDYRLDTRISSVYNGSQSLNLSTFFPIPEIAQNDGDAALIFLSANNVRYSEPVDDAWFAAHQIGSYNASLPYAAVENETMQIYLADEPASVLGCKLQYQVCDPTLPPEEGCSPLGGLADNDFGLNPPTNRRQNAMFWAFMTLSVHDVVKILRTSSLTSRSRSVGDLQSPLPPNQWQAEVENWHNIALAALQGLRVDSTVGTNDPQMLNHFWLKPRNEVEKYLCKNQKVVSTAYTNFSMVWLIIVFVIGLSITVLEYSLEYISVWLERRGILKGSTAEWFINETLQLQRMAHEELGVGSWHNCTGPRAIPVTERGQLLGVFDSDDPKHPKLVSPESFSNLNEDDSKLEQLRKTDDSFADTSMDVKTSTVRTSEDVSEPASTITLIPSRDASGLANMTDFP